MKIFTCLCILPALIMACRNTPHDLTTQLKADLALRVIKIDSSARLDSFRLLGIDSIVPRMGKIIDDTIYSRQLNDVRRQLAHALTRGRKDSIDYFQGEINYMTGQIDTLRESIKSADNTTSFGVLARCYYEISRKGRRAQDSIYYFIRKDGQIFNGEMLDSIVAGTCRNTYRSVTY